MPPTTPSTVIRALRSYASADKARRYAGFFKTGKGQYGEGDRFIGVTVPEVRKVAKEYSKVATLEIVDELLSSPIHEVRLCALILLMSLYKRADPNMQKTIFDFYLAHTKMINNWDLVDLTAPNIVGDFLLRECSLTEDTYFAQTTGFSRRVRRKQNTVSRDKLPEIIIKLSGSKSLWERRISILATFSFIRAGRHQEAFAIAELLLHDDHDLIHKAIGWMLREVGKRVGKDALREFLDKHASTMPRTALRYAIEHMEKEERVKYLHVPRLSRT
jgi:3-methyladenine DNA glycosylase AlkD